MMGIPFRVLIVSPFAPNLDAVHGGARAIGRFALALGERAEVGLIHFRSADEEPADARIMAGCAFVQEVPRERGGHLLRRLLRGGRLLAELALGRPTWAAAFSDRNFERSLNQALLDFKPDIVQIEFHIMGQYIPALRRQMRSAAREVPVVLVLHEPGRHAAEQHCRSQRGLQKLLPCLEARAWEKFEPGILHAADSVVTFTDRDREIIRIEAGELDVHVVQICPPMGIQSELRSSDETLQTESDVLFFGNFAHPPNRHSAERLLNTIMPVVWTQVPEARLILVGPNPDERLASGADARVIVTGRVPEVGPYLRNAVVVSAPLYSGGGMRVKVMEALAAGKALVASPLAVEGLEVTDGSEVAIAVDDESHAQKIVQLMQDPSARVRLEEGARQWTLRHQNPDRIIDSYESIYRGLVASVEP